MPIAKRNPQYFAQLREEESKRNAAAFGGRRSRSAASNMYPHLNTNSPATAKAMNPRPQSSTAARIYPHLAQQSVARMPAPKPKPRVSRARRIYGDEY
jgi:hypothetical protein